MINEIKDVEERGYKKGCINIDTAFFISSFFLLCHPPDSAMIRLNNYR
jgi:hypothetical protein